MLAVRVGRTVLHNVNCKGLSETKNVMFSMYTNGCTLNVTYRSSSRLMSTTPTEQVVIRIPKPMLDRIEKTRQVKRRTNSKVPVIKPGRLLIKSKNPQLNQSAGFTLGKFEETRLCSRGWKHSRSFGDYFTINSTQTMPPFITECEPSDSDPSGSATFNTFQIHQGLVEILRRENIIHPTSVQRKVIPKLLRGHNVLCAAETGSGKTLTYLLPIIHDLQEKKEIDNDANTHTVVLVPSRELAEQVAMVARMLGQEFNLTVKVLGGGMGVGNIKAAFTRGQPDVLVTTPGALLKAMWRNYVDLSKLRYFVVDEADTMFDPSFSGMLERILLNTDVASTVSETRGLSPKAQLVLVGATFPEGVGELLSKVTDLGSVLTIKSQRLHHLMPHVKQTFVKVKGADKLLELNHALKKVEQEQAGVLVFCNSASTVNWLGFALEELGVRHVRLQGAMPAAMREGIFQNFQKGLVDVLVCTDIASRGLDTQRVKLIVNYDFPVSHTDYIHRAGRVGRAGGQAEGEVLSFVTHKWDVEMVQKIETAARRRACLPGMESEIHQPSPKPDDDQNL
ncbi:probable ATP-dependent RNA helicase DDX28 [Clupea harengus]|uniref:Probable ATP-dependent RNA helicase DDX28 n=1 Tax=Clupea harengus TaxID=7950 RepID=A0A6P3VW12_CLUHA|nr:probable ATP-dependent RNA helicase DDX28 [Clupea harengus]